MATVGMTPASDLKGGDAVQIGGRVREVFDTVPQAHGAFLVRYFDDAGEVKALRVYARETLRRLPFECLELSRGLHFPT